MSNRPELAGSVLQTPLWLVILLSCFVKIFSQNFPSQTVGDRELKCCKKVHLPPPPHLSCVICHMSSLICQCHVSQVTCHYFFIFLYQVVKLVVWGFVINMATASSYKHNEIPQIVTMDVSRADWQSRKITFIWFKNVFYWFIKQFCWRSGCPDTVSDWGWMLGAGSY